MRKSQQSLVALALVGVLAAGCYGPFNLTRRLHHWNGQVGQRWAQEGVFILLAYFPVYGICTLGDALIFNSIEFWGGQNPISPPTAAITVPTKRFSQGDLKVQLALLNEGRTLKMDTSRGQTTQSITLERGAGPTVLRDAHGQVLLMAEMTDDGGTVIKNGAGAVMARYTAKEAAQIAQRMAAAQ